MTTIAAAAVALGVSESRLRRTLAANAQQFPTERQSCPTRRGERPTLFLPPATMEALRAFFSAPERPHAGASLRIPITEDDENLVARIDGLSGTVEYFQRRMNVMERMSAHRCARSSERLKEELRAEFQQQIHQLRQDLSKSLDALERRHSHDSGSLPQAQPSAPAPSQVLSSFAAQFYRLRRSSRPNGGAA